MVVRISEGISKVNAGLICEWSNTKGPDFQELWTGHTITYPLDSSKIKDLEHLFSIFHDDEFIGVIQRVKVEDENIHMGRFFLNPEKTGRGLGKKALEAFANMLFTDPKIKSISLNVYDFNLSAIALYEKMGFKTESIIESPKKMYTMKKYR